MIRVLSLVAVCLVAAAQEKPQQEGKLPEPVRRVVDVKHLTGDRAERAVRLVNNFMHPVGNMSFDPVLRTAVIIGPEDVVKNAEALFAKFDSPGAVRPDRQVQFRIYLVEASPDPALTGPVPPEIAGAVEQMKKSFAYKGYRLLDTVLLQARGSGEARSTGTLPARTERGDIRASYNLYYRQADILEDGKTVMLRDFQFSLQNPIQNATGGYNFSDTSVRSDLTLQNGQKLVVGKLSSEHAQNAVFLIITADVQ